jgi:hypothetical protein
VSAIEEIQAAIGVAPELEALRSSGFGLLLKSGEPVDRAEWAEASDIDVSTLDEILQRRDVAGRIRMDSAGCLVGIAGLSVVPTSHEIEVDGVVRWTWCALDAVGILGALAANGAIVSREPGSGRSIRIGFAGGVPESDAALFILGGYDGGSVVEDWCPMVNFFANSDDARAWVVDQGLRGDIVTVAEVVSAAAEMWRPVVAGIEPRPQAG